MAGLALQSPQRPRRAVQFLVGLGLAGVAAVGAPSSALLPGPTGAVETATAAIMFAVAFSIGLAAPTGSFYGVIALTTLEGAIRKWLYNDVTVFLLKDFLLIGVYAAVLPRLSWREARRPWSLVVPLVLLLVLVVALAAHNPSRTGALVGLRSYFIYLPLLWVAPAVIDGERRARLLLALIAGLGVVESALGITQAIVGPGVLNKLVSGAQPALLTVGRHDYLRPPGTFMQVANLADFLVFVVLAAFALLSWKRGGWGRQLAVVAFVFLSGATVYTAARTLLASIVLVVAPAVGFLLFRRRWAAALAGPAALATGVFLMLVVVPYAGSVFTGGAGSVGAGFLGRAADIQHAGGDNPNVGLWSERIRPQLSLIADQSLIGHGTGTMTLGLEYANPGQRLFGESSYSKVAWEVGLVGLGLFLWFLTALLWLSLRGFALSSGWENACAAVGLGAAVLAPLWMMFTFALDFPIVAELFFAFIGIAVAVDRRPGRGAPRSAGQLASSTSDSRSANLP